MSSQLNSLIDLNEVEVIKQPNIAVEQALGAPEPPPAPAPEPQPQQYTQPPAAQPTAVPTGVDVSQAPGGPPVQPGDSPRVQTRINKLYAQKKSAEELVALQQQQIEQLRAQMTQIATAQPREVAADPGYYNPGPVGNQEPATPFVSRNELYQVLSQLEQERQRRDDLRHAQSLNRAEAEKDFPEVFQIPELHDAYNTILAQDALLQGDPQGPYKAALMARGSQDTFSQTSTGGLSLEARKRALSGVGASVPEGSASPNDTYQQYRAAVERARVTRNPSDEVRAYQLLQRLNNQV